MPVKLYKNTCSLTVNNHSQLADSRGLSRVVTLTKTIKKNMLQIGIILWNLKKLNGL